MQLDVNQIYCLHHPPLVARHDRLSEFFKKNSLNPVWVTGYLPQEITIDECHKIMNQMIQKNIIELPNTSVAANVEFAKKKSKNLVSLYKKQMYCVEQQVSKQYDTILILEDDVDTTDPKFNEAYVNECLNEFKKLNGDLLFIGTCCDLHSRNTPNFKHIVKEYTSRCAHMYVVTLNAAKKLMQHLPDISDAYDWKLNDVIKKENLSVYWVEPGIEQFGYVSSLVGEIDGKKDNKENK